MSGPCNPANSNYSVFWDVAGPGSWLELVPQAGHMQFTNISNGLIARALDLICHTGKTNHEVRHMMSDGQGIIGYHGMLGVYQANLYFHRMCTGNTSFQTNLLMCMPLCACMPLAALLSEGVSAGGKDSTKCLLHLGCVYQAQQL